MAGHDSLAETVPRTTDPVSLLASTDAELRVVHPAELVTSVRLGLAPIVIGRRPEAGCSLRLSHPTVSRQHFAVAWDAKRGAHVGRDLGSRNGSRVAGQRLQTEGAELADNEVIRLGDVLLVYERNPGVGIEDAEDVSHDAIAGCAAAIRRLRASVARAGPDPSPALIVGETGTGKEYVARELHRLSGRKGPMLAINCAALSSHLIDSQLFGHARGAFTGAQSSSPGLFRAADGGSLLLDEIGELPQELQAKLLRVLQEREVLGLGETRAVRVDVRVLAATLRDLGELARKGVFRLDLYARLGLWELRVPALRERRADLLDWIARLTAQWYGARSARAVTPPEFDADAAERLLLYDWPDNLRGVDRLVHYLCSEPSRSPIRSATIEAWLARATGAPNGPAARARATEPAEQPLSLPAAADAARPGKPSRDELAAALDRFAGSVRATAKHFGRERRQIYRWMQQYGLRVKSP